MQRALKMASGEIKAELVLKNANVLNVFSEEWIKTDVAICGQRIVGVGTYEGDKTVDLSGKYIVPGFIDAHMHIESSMVTPQALSEILLQKGTTTIIADPHELVNVKKDIALDWLLNTLDTLLLDVYIMLPSSVPSSDFETNGAGEFLAKDMQKYIDHPRVLGLGETMRYLDVINGEQRMLDKLALFGHKIIDGHAPDISDKQIQAYALAGVNNDHECVSFAQAIEKVRAGFYIFIREGSGARNLQSIVQGFLANHLSFDRCMFCTDDKHLDDIEKEGHISYCIKKAIALGVNPITAYRMSSHHAAQVYGLKHKGAIAAGYDADIVVLDDVKEVRISAVYKAGELIHDQIDRKAVNAIDERLLHSVILPELTKEKISLRRKDKNDIIEMQPFELLTLHQKERVKGDEYFEADKTYNKLCVIERHGRNGNIAVAPLKGFGIEHGALATTVAHDSHNLIVAGDNDEDILLAVKTLEEIQGGYVIVSNQQVLEVLPLPICGLMSMDRWQKVQQKTEKMLKIARSLKVSENIDPFITLAFMALPVIPQIRLTDYGLYDVVNNKFVKK